MTNQDSSIEAILHSLQERAKELNCLYEVDGLLSQRDQPWQEILRMVARALPPGWQFPEVCRGAVDLDGREYVVEEFERSEWSQHADIVLGGEKVGEVSVYYLERRPPSDEGPFLKEERKLLNTIADRIALYILQMGVRTAHENLTRAIESVATKGKSEWRIILDFLRRTDPPLLATIIRKMINHLCRAGVEQANDLLTEYLAEDTANASVGLSENRPLPRGELEDITPLAERTFQIAEQYCSEEEMIFNIRGWIEEDKALALVEILETAHSGLSEIAAALDRFRLSDLDEEDIPWPLRTSMRVALLRRFFSDDLKFLAITKDRVRVADFYRLMRRVVYSSKSRGRLGGKSTGLFLARTLLESAEAQGDVFKRVKTPRTWYITSDSVLEFIRHNKLDDVYDHKYQDIERIRRDYPHLVQVFKNSQFPTDLSNGLAAALDDLGEGPLIIRSSSLLEDQTGAAFSGKYKSLFVANQGTKAERLAALKDAVAEVYASIFAPDPIEYRAERGLLDVHEEMAIMIQQVVGFRVGKYFLPSYAGVAFSRNEFRWSPRISRDDGLVRLVPGLGTRSVDRLSDDYPVLLAPGQPGLRVNITMDEVIRYSPQKVDVINLETNGFQTVTVRDLMQEIGDDYPLARRIVSIVSDDSVRTPSSLEPDWAEDDVIVTFAGLIEDGAFAREIREILQFLSEALGYPVDLEFACDGKDLYLLQCRAQSASADFDPSPIPRHLPREKLVFTANRYVSNGRVPDITHIVYVDAEAYANLRDLQDLMDVARAVGKLNKILPRRQFVLVGPGRWGSRGDIKLGVGVTYGDINNTAALMEVARKKGNYTPEPSFGTHFFQDLVEADIRYLPLYPEDEGVIFNHGFFIRKDSILKDVLPEYAHLDEVLRVIDVPRVADGQILKILLNADLDEAVGILALPSVGAPASPAEEFSVHPRSDNHWRWRLLMAERIAAELDPARFGVKAMYVIGSAKNATSGPGSDIDIIIHFTGTPDQHEALSLWLDGWSRSLAEINYLRTGYRTSHLLDIHFVSDEDIEKQTSFAVKIGAITDAARPLRMGPSEKGP